jgi:hypothetical protein
MGLFFSLIMKVLFYSLFLDPPPLRDPSKEGMALVQDLVGEKESQFELVYVTLILSIRFRVVVLFSLLPTKNDYPPLHRRGLRGGF